MSEPRDCIGRFQVTAELGRGSMGIVHRAHDPLMGRDVAIKTVLLPHGLPPEEKDEFQERFLREARAAGRLSHPGIVTVYDFNDGAAADCPFIAMEYVDGPTLHELILAEGALEPSWVLSVGETLADALQTAHDAGIVHRDLKPANILVRRADGVAKISDFGVARVNHSELTGAGATYGSPAYMAPERLRGAPADSRSDLFALAVILYEVLCGQRPFGGDNFAATCAAILYEPPPSIRRSEPSLAPAFDRFFARALAKDPNERFQTGAELRRALRALREEQECFRRGETTRLIEVAVEHAPSTAGAPAGAPAETTASAPACVRDPEPAAETSPPAVATGETGEETAGDDAPSARAFDWRNVLVPAVILVALVLAAVFRATREPSPQATPPSLPLDAGAAAESLPAGVPDTPALPPLEARRAPESVPAHVPDTPPRVQQQKNSNQENSRKTDKKTEPPRPAAPVQALPQAAAPHVPPVAPSAASAVSAPSTARAATPARLELSIKSRVKAGTLSLLVDGETVYTTALAAESPGGLGRREEEIAAGVEIPPGQHTLVARLVRDGDPGPIERSLPVEIEAGATRGLAIVVGRRSFGQRLTLTLE
jgi:hypothetical protein